MNIDVRTQVNGLLLEQYQGKPVSIIGNVLKTNSNGSFDIQTSDNMVVTVTMQDQLMEPVSGLIEVQGIAQGRTAVKGGRYLMFPGELANTYDAALDNEAIILCNAIPNPWQ